MRRPFGRELGASPQAGSFAPRSESFFDKTLAGTLTGRYTRAYGFGNLFIGQLLVCFEQNPSAREFAATGFAIPAQA
jgi:hypothetical protein